VEIKTRASGRAVDTHGAREQWMCVFVYHVDNQTEPARDRHPLTFTEIYLGKVTVDDFRCNARGELGTARDPACCGHRQAAAELDLPRLITGPHSEFSGEVRRRRASDRVARELEVLRVAFDTETVVATASAPRASSLNPQRSSTTPVPNGSTPRTTRRRNAAA